MAISISELTAAGIQLEADEAVAIAKECPALEHGAIVEVRPIAEICPTMAECGQQATAEKELATASA
jgi:hypothetical protein